MVNDHNIDYYEKDIMHISSYIIKDSEIRLPTCTEMLCCPRFEEFKKLLSGIKLIVAEENEAVDDQHDLLRNNRYMRDEEVDGYVDLIHSAIHNTDDGFSHNNVRNRKMCVLNNQLEVICNVSVSVHPEKPNITCINRRSFKAT